MEFDEVRKLYDPLTGELYLNRDDVARWCRAAGGRQDYGMAETAMYDIAVTLESAE